MECSPMAMHNSVQSFFSGTVFGSLFEKLGVSQTMGLVAVGSGIGM